MVGDAAKERSRPLFETDENACPVVTCLARDIIALKSDIKSINIS